MTFSTNGLTDERDSVFDEGRDPQTPPHSEHAEQAVFGSILKYPPCLREVIEDLEWRDFYTTRHQSIWKALTSLEADGKPIDYHLLADRLQTQGTYESSGGLLYLSEVNLATPTSAFISHYAEIVIRKSMLRRLSSLLTHAVEAAWRDDKDPDAIMAELERRLGRLRARRTEMPWVTMADAVDGMMTTLEQQREAFRTHDPNKGEYFAGWKTGFADLDRTLMGLKPGDLIYLAARTSVGKSIVAQQIAMSVANHGGPVYFASLEMSQEKLMHRATAMRTGTARHEMVRGNTTDAQQKCIRDTAEVLHKLPLVWDTKSRTTDQIRHAAERWSEQIGRPIALIVVDYVQLLRDQAGQRANRYENVSLASHNLKDMAEMLHTTVLAPAQVSRSVATRAAKSRMPDLSDLRESGDLEQDADVVLGLDRDDYYDRNAADHTATLAVLKARDLAASYGRGRMVGLAWLEEFERYADLERDNVVPFRGRHQTLKDDLPDDLPQAPADGGEPEDLPF